MTPNFEVKVTRDHFILITERREEEGKSGVCSDCRSQKPIMLSDQPPKTQRNWKPNEKKKSWYFLVWLSLKNNCEFWVGGGGVFSGLRLAQMQICPGPITLCSVQRTFVKPEGGLLSIFVGQSLYLFEVRHNPAKDFSGAHVCSASPEHVFGWFFK